MIFYVYEHWRPDLDVCFYVGKGKGVRAHSLTHRNARHMQIQRELASIGTAPEIRIVGDRMTEFEALDLERARIAFWRSQGVELANKTAGGQGISGHKHSEASKAKMRQSAIGRVNSPEARAKLAAAKRGIPQSEASNAKRSKALAGKRVGWAASGRRHSEASKAKASASLKLYWERKRQEV